MMAISKWHEAKTWPTKRMDHDLPTSTTWNKQGNIINNINITDEKTLQNIKNISSKKKRKKNQVSEIDFRQLNGIPTALLQAPIHICQLHRQMQPLSHRQILLDQLLAMWVK